MNEMHEPLIDKQQTADRIRWLVSHYSHDLDKILVRRGVRLLPISSLSLFAFFDLVKRIPYRQDSEPTEIVARPRIILDFSDRGHDCKRKAILVAAYCERNHIPWRLVATSRRPDRRVHHVYVQAEIDGSWRNLDATYPDYTPFETKTVTSAQLI